MTNTMDVLVRRLQDAIEGEVDGLAISKEAAYNIVVFLLIGHDDFRPSMLYENKQ